MGFIDSLRARPARRGLRGSAFPAADMGRLTASWTTDPGSINRWLRYELSRLVARSRQLARGDAYASKFIRSCVDNIAGPDPFILQSKGKFKNGKFDTQANKTIETAWSDRCRPGGCEITGRMSLAALHRLIIRCLARDGEVLIRKIRGADWGAIGRLQLLDIDRLDAQRNEDLTGGGAIKLGVQIDAYSRPVAYHVLKQHPGEMGEWNRGAFRQHEVIPAKDIIHLFVPDWPEQVRGFPWMHAAMVRLWHLGGFEEAAVINARIGASKIATIESRDGDPPQSMVTGKDSAGNLLNDTEPGQYWTLPAGYTLGSFTPSFPDQAVEPFIAACLRGAAAAVGMAYHSMANDPGAVNYSTARMALLEERDMWAAIQCWYVEHFCEPDAVEWLRGAILDYGMKEHYFNYRNDMVFQAKTWKWLDPQKEVTAKIDAMSNKLTSRTRLAAEDGQDIEDIFNEIAAEEALAKEKGISLQAPVKAPAKPAMDDEGMEPGDSPAAKGNGKGNGKDHLARP